MKNLTKLSALAACALVVAGCSAPEPTPESTPTSTPTRSPDGGDLLDAVNESLGSDVDSLTSIEQTEPGRIEMHADLVDDRGDGSDPDALRAMALCEGAARVDGVEYVVVYEADGTSWILYGHPAVANGECGEY